MGLLSLFKKDWAAELDRVVRYLEDEEPVLALDLLRKIEGRVEGEPRERAQQLRKRAEVALYDSLIQRAEEAQAEGKLSDAADWLEAAIERSPDATQRRELEARREEILEELEVNPFAEAPSGLSPDPGGMRDDDEVEIHYDAIVQTLRPEIAELFRDRPAPFPELIVSLNHGEIDEALAGIETLLDEDPDDPILRLERGRALLITGELEPAREDFEVAWEALGSAPLDEAGVLSIPQLWAETTILDDPGAVVDRLEPIAQPGETTLALAQLYAGALLRLGAHDRALPYLQTMLRHYPTDVSFAHLLAQILIAKQEHGEAVDCLEAAVGPSCSGGRCTAGPRHVPALRTLAELHLVEGPNPLRTAELMAIIAQTRGGRLAAEDHRILAKYYHHVGDEKAAEHAAEEAVRLAAAGPEAESAPTPSTGQQRVL